MNFASDKASFCKIQTRLQVNNFNLKVLSEVLFINFCSCSMLSYPNFPIVVHIIAQLIEMGWLG